MKRLKQLAYIKYVIAKLSKFVKISMHTSLDYFYRRFSENLKGLQTSFQAIFFIKSFDKNFSFIILHKLAKFHYQTVFTFQFLQ